MTDKLIKDCNPKGHLKRLDWHGIKTLQDLAACTPGDLLRIRGFGRTSVRHAEDLLFAHGLRFRSNPPIDPVTSLKNLGALDVALARIVSIEGAVRSLRVLLETEIQSARDEPPKEAA